MSDHLENARQIAEAVFATDMNGLPLYLVQPEMGQHVGGWYSPCNDAIFRDQIEASGGWRGPGPCVAICLDTEEFQGIEDDHDRERWILGVVLHELTHFVDYSAEKVQPRERTQEETATAWATIEARITDEQPASRLPWIYRTHGASFTRLACHVWYRANKLFPISPYSLCFGNVYPSLWLLESPRVYIDSLRDELEEYPATSPLRVLPWGFDPPEAYTSLWRSTQFSASGIAHAITP